MLNQKLKAFARFLGKILNIAPHEVPRILLAWVVKFCFFVGFTIGWTMLTAMLVGRVGITYLPLLYVANAFLIIFSTIFFSDFVHRFSKNKLIYATILSGTALLGSAIFLFHSSENLWLFLGIALLAESVFFAQLNILLSLFIEDLFSPLESERAFPLVEASEYLGGISGGLLILFALDSLKLEAVNLTYFWLGAILLIFPILLSFNILRKKLPTLSNAQPHVKNSKLQEFRKSAKEIRKIPFFSGLVFVILLQWMFFTMLDFQYTKAVDANITSHNAMEEVSANADSHDNHSENVHPVAPAHHSQEDLLTHGLGLLHVIFYTIALFVQLLLTSRIIGKIGIVRTLRLHPLASFISTSIMSLKFGFPSAVFAKGLFESTTGIFNSAYHSSFYSLKESLREKVKEFCEGLIRPLGVMLATGLLLALEFFLDGKNLTLAINGILLISALTMGFVLTRGKKHYTKVVEGNLNLFGKHPQKFNAVELLAQPGHHHATQTLLKHLFDTKQPRSLKIKILQTLGKIREASTIPSILNCFEDESKEVQLNALHALRCFENLDSHTLSQAFTHHRVVEALKELFEKSKSQEIRSLVVEILGKLKNEVVVDFLLEELETSDPKTQADCLYACGLFHDVGSAKYVEKYLGSDQPEVKANAIIALWQFPEYRLKLTLLLDSLIEAKDTQTKKLAIHTLGEIEALHEKPRLLNLLGNADDEIRLFTAFALAKLKHQNVNPLIADFVLHPNKDLALLAKKHLRHLHPKTQKEIGKIIHHKLSQRLHSFLTKNQIQHLEELPPAKLEILKNLYEAAGDLEEASKVEAFIEGVNYA